MSAAGWYPDPGQQPGMYRYWDGSQWSTALSPSPYAPPPPPAWQGHVTQAAPGVPQARPRSSGRGPVWAWALVGIVVVALVFGAVQLLSGGGPIGPLTPTPPPANPTDNYCPKRTVELTLPPHTNPAGRVQGGKLSYPRLGAPWSPPSYDDRMPFGRDVSTQTVMVEPNYDGPYSWVASVLVAELVAGDGFFSPQQGSEIVSRCVLGEFYGDNEVQSTTTVDKAVTVDGHDAWLREMHLTFDIRNLKEKGETVIVLIVATGEESSSVYYASIPDSRPELLQVARDVQAQLRVEP